VPAFISFFYQPDIRQLADEKEIEVVSRRETSSVEINQNIDFYVPSERLVV
jgi:hypothetical protein